MGVIQITQKSHLNSAFGWQHNSNRVFSSSVALAVHRKYIVKFTFEAVALVYKVLYIYLLK